MPKVVNRNAHGVRTAGENKVRLRAGEVRELEGEQADAALAINGVESANSDDEKAWDNYLATQRGNPSGEDSGKASLDRAVSDARVASRNAAVSLPLNTVVGDDDAPLGPPSGTITTKQAVVRAGGQAEKRAFGDHERQPEEADNERLSPVERKQAEAKAALEELHDDALKTASEAGNEAATPSDQLTQPKPTEAGGRKQEKEAAAADEPGQSEGKGKKS